MEYQSLTEHELALHEAAKAGNFERVQSLLLARTELNIRVGSKDPASDDSTALHHAAANGHEEICGYLMSMGGCVYWRNRNIETPADLAHKNGHYELAAMLKSAERHPPKMFEEFYAEFLPASGIVAA